MRQVLCPVLVGRHEELGLLQAALDDARAGRGRLVLIQGEAGVGKSRLTLHLESAARSAAMRVLRGRAAASSSSVPFRPLAEALLGATRAAGPPQAPELVAYRSVLGALIPEWAGEEGPMADHGLLLQEAALRLLRVLAGAAGALVTLEDLHWADAETLAPVQYLADNLAAERLLCLATMRSDEPRGTPALPGLLVARRNALVLALERLPEAEVEAMARAALDAPSLPEGLGPLLASRAEGVPFLVEEVLAACVASGALARERGGWALRGDLVTAAALAEREGAVSAQALALQNQCWPALLAGRWEELAAANGRCVELCRRFGLGLLPHALIVTALLQAVRVDARGMEAALREAEDATDDPNIHGAAWGSRGTLALLREDRARAVDAFERAVGLLRRTQGVTNWHFLGTRAVLVELEGRGGERARSELGGIGAPLAYWNEASLDQSQAIALGRTGHAGDAEAAFRRAAARLGRAPWLGALHARLVAEAAVADRWGDPAGWLRQALPVLEAAGHDRVAAACKALLRRAGAPLPRKGRGASAVPPALASLGVTSREVDVLRLVADGLPNREIAARLFLSPRTVETHVASLQRRTRSRTRADLVALAADVLARESQG